ncbi:hypothetical protein ACVIIV_005075 [Bradyrhizobium sp. USDA 4354]
MTTEKTHRPPVDTRGAAIYTGFAESYLTKIRCTGGGPVFIKRNGTVRYDLDDLDAWLEAGKLASTSGERRGIPRKRRVKEAEVAA